MPVPREAMPDASWSYAATRRGRRARRLVPVAALALLSLALLPGTALGGRDVNLTDSASGRTISVATGATITIVLESNASTGYHWTVATAPDSAVLDALSGSGAYAPSSSDLLGAAGTQTFRYRAVGDGTTRLVLTYVAPGTAEVGKTFRLAVEVGPGAGGTLPATTTGDSGSGIDPLVLLGLALVAGGLAALAFRTLRLRRSA